MRCDRRNFHHPSHISTGRRPRTCTISPRTAYSALMTFELIVSKLSGAFSVFGIVRWRLYSVTLLSLCPNVVLILFTALPSHVNQST